MILRNALPAALAAVLWLFCSGDLAWTADQPAAVDIAASINGQIITQEQLDAAFLKWKKNLRGRPIPEDRIPAIKKQILQQMITKELILSEAVRQHVSVSDKEVEEAIDQIKKRFPEEEAFAKALAQADMTMAELKKEIHDQQIMRNLLKNEIGGDFKVTDEEAEAFYNKHKEIFAKPKEVRASHILVKVSKEAGPEADKKARDKIEAILKRLQNNEDFALVARETSEDATASQGGDLGFFIKERMAREFSEAAFALQVGQISDVVKTRYGYHIIKVTDIHPEVVPPYEEVKKRVMDLMKAQDQKKKINEYIESLRKKADIQIMLK